MVVGSFFRIFASQSFDWLLIGNALVSIAQPLVLTNTSTCSLKCVGAQHQGWYIGAASLSALLGGAWGFVVSSYLVQTTTDYGHYFGRIELLYLGIDLLVLAGLIWVCVRRFYRERRGAIQMRKKQ